MSAASHPYRQGGQSKKYVLRYWPVPGQLASSLVVLAVVVALTALFGFQALGEPTERLICTRDDGATTCALIEERPWREPRTRWRVEGILDTTTAAPGGDDGILVRLRGDDPTDDTLRFGTIPVTNPDQARTIRSFLASPGDHEVAYTTGPGPFVGYFALFFAGWTLVTLVRLPRPVVFTIDEDRGTFDARFGSLLIRHSTRMPLTEIDRVEVIVTEARMRRLQLVRKDGQIEIFDEKFRVGEHHHQAADLLWTTITQARHDQV